MKQYLLFQKKFFCHIFKTFFSVFTKKKKEKSLNKNTQKMQLKKNE